MCLKGVTIVASSGDDGAFAPDLALDSGACSYAPNFPASSPYVTAVGATFGPESGEQERACQADLGGLITSGGGFSTNAERPFWQNSAVTSYLEGNLPGGLFNKNGRGIPDVSLLGHNFEEIIGGIPYAVSGTSASAPLFAAMVSLVNAARLQDGKGPIGFLNIILYDSYKKWANDITVGDNSCSGTSRPHCCDGRGFTATNGWDPVTGLGSVNFSSFSSFLTNLTGKGKQLLYINLSRTI